ncbi:glycoside hydrolase family 2, partial [candidate division KSB1 bacterium]|nr:glycoside hydrolase family 2 [candidate division KSB1 bacterium]
MKLNHLLLLIIISLFFSTNLLANETEFMFLSGTGSDNTVDWEFYCTGGRNSGYWTTIPVPSCWEQQGFGTYNYGHNKNPADEAGKYSYRFSIPARWAEKHIDIVFEGSMTDTEVKINGQLAGPVHQGALYRFS